jgi:hypothetical protein
MVDNCSFVNSEFLGTVKILSRKKEMKYLVRKKIRLSERLQLERSFSMLAKQKSKLMEGVLDIWCRGQEKGLGQSLENLNGASLGCGFIKNTRATGKLFQIKLSSYGKSFNMIMSSIKSQLLQMLKLCQDGNGDVVINLDCNILGTLMICWDAWLISSLEIRERKKVRLIVEKMDCLFIRVRQSFFGELEQESELVMDNFDVLCQGPEIGFC